jgi:hypothetical protein
MRLLYVFVVLERSSVLALDDMVCLKGVLFSKGVLCFKGVLNEHTLPLLERCVS